MSDTQSPVSFYRRAFDKIYIFVVLGQVQSAQMIKKKDDDGMLALKLWKHYGARIV
jgi:hypothetical protein